MPTDHAEQVKRAVFDAGAGRQGDYEQCCWQTLGTGQFMPKGAAHPFVGQVGSLHREEELKVEMICEDAHISDAVAALKLAHPYEEPAYQVDKLAPF